ncbi:hypothetical protein [Nitrospina watsonii]|uniref:Uncharacterized protein n=1 Tax=Nitrospina watsonii TaxID=1323948 RepID=A0ABN8VXR7_9BACT|nr:hypothetical protein [Nitrospina watsonii]CAI2716908.1 protein of unknown function [Nitrospina watsonii]
MAIGIASVDHRFERKRISPLPLPVREAMKNLCFSFLQGTDAKVPLARGREYDGAAITWECALTKHRIHRSTQVIIYYRTQGYFPRQAIGLAVVLSPGLW